jgi:hypothetical protein
MSLLPQDVTLTQKRATRLGTLQIKQYVPRGKLFLVPSPEIKVSHSGHFCVLLLPALCIHQLLVCSQSPGQVYRVLLHWCPASHSLTHQ